MANKLKIIPLGGLNEIGKNMTVYEYGGDILVVDCGMAFPDTGMFGIDLVIPDMSYLIKHKNRVRALVITHGHEDHVGAVPFLLQQINVPIYCTRLTAGLIDIKLQEFNLSHTTDIYTLEAGESFEVGCFSLEFIRVNHSIAGSVSLAITTPLGVVIHSGDFKIDSTPVGDQVIDLARFGQLGQEGVLALLSDSTNVERPGYAMSERKVGESLDALFRGCDRRIIVTTFASNVHRIQQIIDAAAKHGRRVAITGRSMENILRVAIELDYMDIPPNTIMELSQVKGVPRHKVVIVTTGSQGEPMSALYRMAISGHKQVEIGAGDRVIISASPIPGNEKMVSRVINELFRKGAEVIYERLAEVHVSGHACQEELKLMLALTRPRYFMPVHGEYRHLRAHAALARLTGVDSKHIFVANVGQVLTITENSAKFTGTAPAGQLLIDGLGIGDVGNMVLRDRKVLAEDGLIVVVVTLDAENGQVTAGPDIVSRGFVYVKESEALMEEMRRLCLRALNLCYEQHITDWSAIKAAIKTALSDYLYKKIKRSPMILPVIMES
ncbi:MAG: ribonuclease J [Oscillospiraceae bacterium]|nr:ribonuclease J [Oscillospiraceae bacterium]